MKQTILFLLSIMAIFTLGACHREPKWMYPEAHMRTLELNAKYREKMIGDWYLLKQTDNRRLYETLKLKADSTFKATVYYACRDTVQVNGEKVVTDWEIRYEETYEGNWSLFCSSTMNDILDLSVKIGSGGHYWGNSCEFFDLSGDELLINDFFFREKSLFRRGTIEPPF